MRGFFFRALLRHRLLALLALLAVTVAFGRLLVDPARLLIDFSLEALLVPDQAARADLESLRRDFGDDVGMVGVVVALPEGDAVTTVFDDRVLSAVADLTAAYCESDCALALMRVDLGGSADHVVRKCRADERRRMEDPRWRELIDAGRFRIVILTTTDEKAEAIRQSLARDPRKIRFTTVVIEDLIPLLT